jgi:PrcB C-terminal
MKKRLLFLMVVFAMSGLLVALSGKDDQQKQGEKTQTKPGSQTQTQPQTEVTVTYEIIQQGTYSGIKEPLTQIITNQKDWEDLWKKHVSVIVPQPLVPEIDFNMDVIAAIFSGEKHTSGYRIVLKSIVASENDVVVTYQETQPPENSFTLQVLTQPFVMIKVSKPVGSVRLVKE